MPNWKKVIVSGSSAALTSVTATAGFTGSLSGSATSATSASYALTASNITPAISNDVNDRVITANGNGTLNGEGNLTFNGQTLGVLYGVGDEGGEILLGKAATNTSLTGSGVTVDVFQNKLRFFEQGGTARGFYLDISTGGGGASTNLASGGGTVTSVDTAGTVNGITLTGGPITGAGTITLGGTLSGITPSQLATSSIRIGSTSIALGATASLLTGLTSINSTSFTGSLQGTASYATQALSASWAPGGGNAFPYTGSAEITGSLEITGSFSVNNGTNVKLDTATSTLTDDSNISSVDWQNRISYDTSQLQSIDWRNRDLIDTNESSSLNWSGRTLSDSGTPGGSGFSVSSINWENRQAYDTVGNISIDWSGTFGLNIVNYRPTIEISNETSQDEFIATTTGFGSIASNFAGKLIEVGPNIDLAVTASNTVFLDTDGVWKLADQSTDNTTKLLGICINGYVRGAILIDGIVTVTTSSAIIDVPYVRGSNFYGMPVYLTGSQSSLTTTKPTSGYVRVVGHMYYNSATTPNYWIMKFNPSNDWYEI
jgi:hypothetical protein